MNIWQFRNSTAAEPLFEIGAKVPMQEFKFLCNLFCDLTRTLVCANDRLNDFV